MHSQRLQPTVVAKDLLPADASPSLGALESGETDSENASPRESLALHLIRWVR